MADMIARFRPYLAAAARALGELALLFRPAQAADDRLGPAATAGWAIIAAFFGLVFLWATIAPLNGAVVAVGVVKVDGNRKSIQHLEGGIVRDIRVRDGDDVQQGDVLLVLDDTQARTEVEIFTKQMLVLRASEQRLRAELRQAPSMETPAEFVETDSGEVQSVWQAQVQQFEMRRAALDGRRRIIGDKIAQLRAQIAGSEAQKRALASQLASMQAEKESLTPLVEKGLVTRPRVLQLERSAAALEGQLGELDGQVARAQQAIAEQTQHAVQLDSDRAAEVTRELRDVQAQLLQVLPKLTNARANLARTLVRAPYAGHVVGLSVFSIGAVVAPGDKILDIVPRHDALVVEVQVPVQDVTEVRPGMTADVHLTAYKQYRTPVVRGRVVQVSADRFTDNRSGEPYFVTLVQLEESGLARYPQVRLYPGMPALVMVQTVERTAFDYLVSPLTSSFRQAFRER